ncbi:hypothetical protein DENSPDRAFT_262417 [Dentipellis sp. KUC8613]|nr:hypothetical protein DENSPDRAFT_262417 [Dentipellis sp. KUC8613]
MSDFERIACPCSLGLYTGISLNTHNDVNDSDGPLSDSEAFEQPTSLTRSRLPTDFEVVLAVIPCTKYPDYRPKHVPCRFKLDDAIKARKESLLKLAARPFEAAMHMGVLARLRHILFLATSKKQHLVTAISGVDRAIRIQALDDYHRAMLWAELAIYHDSSFHHFGAGPESAVDMMKGVECLDKAQGLLADDPFSPAMPYFLRERASLILCHYRCDPDGGNLDDAVDSLRLSVKSIPRPVTQDSLRDLSSCLGLLTDTLMARFEARHISDDLDEAIDLHQQALKLFPDVTVAPDGGIRCSKVRLEATLDALTSYSIRLCTRFTDLGQPDDLQDALCWAELVVGSEYRRYKHSEIRRVNCYVNCRMEEFRAYGRLEDIDAIVDFINNSSDPRYDYTIGRLLIIAFERLRVKDYIDRAVEWLTRAIERGQKRYDTFGGFEARIKGHLGHHDVAAIYEMIDREPAIFSNFVRRPGAIAVPRLNIDWANVSSQYNLLARAFTLRYECSELRQDRDISQALENHAKALARAPHTSHLYHQFRLSLGSSFRVRFEYSGETKYLVEAIIHQRKALEHINSPHPHRARALSGLAQSLVQKCRIASDSEKPIFYKEAIDLFDKAVQYECGFIHDRLNAALLWANLLHNLPAKTPEEELEYLTQALEGYHHSVLLLVRATSMGVSTSSRLAQLSTVPRSLASDAAACAFRVAELDPENAQEHLAKAIELLDQGRAILWSQAAQMRSDLHRLKKVRGDLAKELERISKEQEQASLIGEVGVHSGEMTRKLATQWNNCVTEVRRVKGFDDFLLRLPLGKLRTAARSAPIVIVNTSDHRCDGLIIPSEGELRVVPLKRLVKSDVDNDVTDLLKILERRPEDDRGQFSLMLNNLWKHLGQPILRGLGYAGILTDTGSQDPPHIRWCPTGKLAFLPIHAACPRRSEKPGMLDYVVSSYIPTLSTLLRTQQLSRPTDPPTSPAATAPETHPRILAVCHPGSGPRMERLQFVWKEIEILRKHAEHTALLRELSNKAAKASDVLRELQGADWVHFACHGMRNVADPMESALLLDDRPMRLSELARAQGMGMGLAGEFAMLLACETAMGAPGLSDEAMHIAAGLHFAGFKSIIATMWKIQDDLGPLVTEGIYDYIMGDGADCGDKYTELPSARKAAQALRKTQLFLRDKKGLQPRQWAPFIHYGL